MVWGESLLLLTPSKYRPPISNYKRYKKIIYTRTVNNLTVNMNTYYIFQNIQFYNCYLIKYNILVLLFKYLNNKIFLNHFKYIIN